MGVVGRRLSVRVAGVVAVSRNEGLREICGTDKTDKFHLECSARSLFLM